MFLSVLTENLNWEILTKNLVTFNFIMGFHWKIWFFRADGVHKLEVDGKGFRFKEEGHLVKKRGCSLSLILEDRVHAMTLPNQLTPKQI